MPIHNNNNRFDKKNSDDNGDDVVGIVPSSGESDNNDTGEDAVGLLESSNNEEESNDDDHIELLGVKEDGCNEIGMKHRHHYQQQQRFQHGYNHHHYDDHHNTESLPTWQRRLLTPLLSDNRFYLIEGTPLLDGVASVRLLKFIVWTWILLITMYKVVRWLVSSTRDY